MTAYSSGFSTIFARWITPGFKVDSLATMVGYHSWPAPPEANLFWPRPLATIDTFAEIAQNPTLPATAKNAVFLPVDINFPPTNRHHDHARMYNRQPDTKHPTAGPAVSGRAGLFFYYAGGAAHQDTLHVTI